MDLIFETVAKLGLVGLVILGAGWLFKYLIDVFKSSLDQIMVQVHKTMLEILSQAKEDKEKLYKLNSEKLDSLAEANRFQRQEHIDLQKSIEEINNKVKQMQNDIERGRICRV